MPQRYAGAIQKSGGFRTWIKFAFHTHGGQTIFSPGVVRLLEASDRRRVLVWTKVAPRGGRAARASPKTWPEHELGEELFAPRQNTGLTPLPRFPARGRELQQLPPSGGLGKGRSRKINL